MDQELTITADDLEVGVESGLVCFIRIVRLCQKHCGGLCLPLDSCIMKLGLVMVACVCGECCGVSEVRIIQRI